MNNIFEEIACPICNSKIMNTVLEFTPDEFMNDMRKSYYNLEVLNIKNDTKFYIKKCKNCSFVFVNPRLKDELYDVVYNESKVTQNELKSWKDEEGTNLSYLYNTYHKWIVSPSLFRILSYSRKKFNKAKNDKYEQIKLLDYGCGSGHILELCKPFGIDAKGVDIDNWRIKHCQNKGLDVCRPEDLDENEKFDILISTSVVEHVNDLDKYFAFISKHLKKGGHCSLVGLTPNIIDIEKKTGKYNIVMPLEHLNYFTKKSFDMLIEKHGLKRIKYSNSMQEIIRPVDYIKPFLKNIIFQGFMPTGNMEVDLIKL